MDVKQTKWKTEQNSERSRSSDRSVRKPRDKPQTNINPTADSRYIPLTDRHSPLPFGEIRVSSQNKMRV